MGTAGYRAESRGEVLDTASLKYINVVYSVSRNSLKDVL
jgi:hypothetical protein